MDRITVRMRGLAWMAGVLSLVSCTEGPVLRSLPLDPASSVTELLITPSSVLFPWLGATAQLTATLKNARGDAVTPPRVYWQSSDPKVVTVDSTGTIVGVGIGTAHVVASFLELSDSAVITVARIPASMAISVDTLLFTELGRTADIDVTVRDGASKPIADAKVTWSSSVPSVASVDAQGGVKALADGLATITARVDALSRTTRIRVASRATTMTVTPARISLEGISDTARVVTVVRNAAGVPMYPLQPTYTSSDTTVATVDFIGFVIARKAGSSTITVAMDTLRATVPVTVTQTIASVRVMPDTATISVGATKAYVALVKDRYDIAVPGAAVTWSSSDPAVATISASGLVAGVAPGSASLVARSGTRSDTARVTVR
ncbi:MAG: Ig-like domain-containing protein [Longimicrobiales bacterium]|nr:Ig-like domain-containing protein [Longimicrobiales bacterium]